mmetsp:Transcript_20851/g.45095  ORF Transcript_20851/g.45095 Transcript_20851/m.45095 type:complete len:527 (+) Transcript_20851:251-1831(+)
MRNGSEGGDDATPDHVAYVAEDGITNSSSASSAYADAGVPVSVSSSASASASSSVVDDMEQKPEASTRLPTGIRTGAPKGTSNNKTSNTTAKSAVKAGAQVKDTSPAPRSSRGATNTGKATRKKRRLPKRTRDERLAMNRVTARERRRKKRANISSLQTRVRDLGDSNEVLKRSNAAMRQLIQELSASNAMTANNQQESERNNNMECGASSTRPTCSNALSSSAYPPQQDTRGALLCRLNGDTAAYSGSVAASAAAAASQDTQMGSGGDTSTLMKMQQMLRLQQYQQQQEAKRDKEAIAAALQARILEGQIEVQIFHALQCRFGSNRIPEASGIVPAALHQLLQQREGPTITVPNYPQQPVSGYTTDTTSAGSLSRADSTVSRAGTNSSSLSMPIPPIHDMSSNLSSAPAAATAAELLLEMQQQQQRQRDIEALASTALARYRGLQDGTLTASTSSVAAPASVAVSSFSQSGYHQVSTHGNSSTVANENTNSTPTSANTQGDLLTQLLLLRQSWSRQHQQPRHDQP